MNEKEKEWKVLVKSEKPFETASLYIAPIPNIVQLGVGYIRKNIKFKKSLRVKNYLPIYKII